MSEEPLFFEDRSQWEAWLEAHHLQEEGITMLLYKKHLHAKCISYPEALEAALCYGWIDGKLNRIDDTKHTIRFSPRRKKSIWSKKNRESVIKLLEQKKVKPFGLEKIEEAKANGRWDEALIDEDDLPDLLKAALSKHPKAKAFYDNLPKSAQKQYHWWIIEAKKDATKEKRVAIAIEKLTQGLRFWEEH